MTSCRLVIGGILGLILSAHIVHAAEYKGLVVHVVDGDTFDMRIASTEIVRIRFCGIDTPERGKAGFLKATVALSTLIGRTTVRCVQVGHGTPCDGRSKAKSRDRIVAQCFLGNLDIAAEMIRTGNACDWAKYSGGHYGLERSTCVLP